MLPKLSTYSSVAEMASSVIVGCGKVETDETFGIDRRPELGERYAGREMGCGGSEEVPAVEGPRDRVQRVRRIRELVRGIDPGATRRWKQEPVVGADVGAPLRVA